MLITAQREQEDVSRPSRARTTLRSKGIVTLQPSVGGVHQVIHTSSLEDDGEGLLHYGLAKLEATRAGVRRAQQGMVTKGIHWCLTAWAPEIRREHPHTKAIPIQILEVGHA